MTVRVLHVLEGLFVGGAERALLAMMAQADPARIRHEVCSIGGPQAWDGRVEASGGRLLYVHRRGRYDVRLPFRLAALIRDRGIDIVQGHLFTGNLWGRLGALSAGVPCLATEQSVDRWKDPLRRGLDRLLGRIGTRVVCAAHAVAGFYRDEIGIPGERLHVIHNAYDTAAAPPAPELWRELASGGPAIGFVGRLVDAKDPGNLLEALDRATRTVSGARALIVGDGPERPAMEAWIVRRRAAGRIHLLGASDAAAALWPLVDVGVLASHREGLPVVALEAAAAGVPMAATSAGGTAEAVLDGRSGIVVPVRDAASLASALIELLQVPQRARAYGEAARRHVRENFHPAVIARRWEALYEDVAGGRLVGKAA